MNLLRTKPIDGTADTRLLRCLEALDLTLLGIGCIIVSGMTAFTMKAFLVWFVIGMLAYLSYPRSHSALAADLPE